MDSRYLAFAIPFFIALMLAEYFVAKKRQLRVFNLHNSISNISIGIAERLTDVLISGSFYFVYDYLQHRFGLFTIKPSVLVWVGLLLATDFVWYWYHRLGHKVNLLWMVHIVHHQSEDFNYTISARITVFQAVVRTAFWCVLPIIGFPAHMITVMLLIHGLYPFFVHTRVIGKLGVLEKVLVTPSHHRVHHACNPQYLDKNFGDVLIIWDKLFGTFVVEDEEPVYGLTKPLRTYSFLWQHFHYLIEVALTMRAQNSIKNKLHILFGSPNLIHPQTRIRAERIFSINQTKKHLQNGLSRYVIWQVCLLMVGVSTFIYFAHFFDNVSKFLFTAVTILTLINCGAIMEQKKWIFNVEFLRFLALTIMVWPYCATYHAMALVIICALAFLVLFYKTLQSTYLSVVYPATVKNQRIG